MQIHPTTVSRPSRSPANSRSRNLWFPSILLFLSPLDQKKMAGCSTLSPSLHGRTRGGWATSTPTMCLSRPNFTKLAQGRPSMWCISCTLTLRREISESPGWPHSLASQLQCLPLRLSACSNLPPECTKVDQLLDNFKKCVYLATTRLYQGSHITERWLMTCRIQIGIQSGNDAAAETKQRIQGPDK